MNREKTMLKPIYLHIYEQYTHHADAHIVGERAALEALRDEINAALEGAEGRKPSRVFFQSDGESYQCEVWLATKEQMADLPSNYTAWRGRWNEAEIAAFKKIAHDPKNN
jgi:hypothetical protein